MIELKKVNEVYKFNNSDFADGKAKIICNNGECSITSDTDILGIELEFNGVAEITPSLPENWILQGNKTKIIIFTTQSVPIKNSTLFSYIGDMKIIKSIVVNTQAQKILSDIENVKFKWNNQNWNLNQESENWENFKDRVKVGKVNKTSYVLPDYNLPKVEKTEIKTKRKAVTTTPTYTTGGGSTGGSGGSGGY